MKVEEADYQTKVNTKLKEYAKKATIKGFRQGLVPAGVVKKMYGKSVLVEEVNHIISHSINDFIKEKKLKVLGDPIPDNELTKPIDWDFQKEFEFVFQVGMAAEFKVELSPNVKIQKYKIKEDDSVLQETMIETRKRYSEPTHPEASEATDILYGEIAGSDPGVRKNSYVIIEKVKASEQKRFLGLKKEDVIEFDARQVFEDVVDQAAALDVSEQEINATEGNVSIKINTINRTLPAELNQEFFDKVFGKEAVTSEEAFINKVKETIAGNYERETQHLLDHEIEHYLMDHISVDLPDAFLKKWLKATGGEITDEVLEKEFDSYKKSIKYDLIRNQVAEENKISVETQEVQERARMMILSQFGGMTFPPELFDRMEKITENYLQSNNGQNFLKIYNTLRTEKIMATIKTLVTISEKEVTLEEFKSQVDAHRH